MDSATPCATQIRGVCVGGVRRGWNLLSSHRRNTDLLTALRHSLTASLRLVCARALYLYSFVIRDSPRARWGWGRLGCVGTLELSALWTDWSVGLEGQRRVQGAGTGHKVRTATRTLFARRHIHLCRTSHHETDTFSHTQRAERQYRGTPQQGTAHRSPLHTNQTPNGRRRDARDVVALLNTHIYGTTRHIYVLLGGRSRRSVPHLDSPPSLRSSALPIIDICSRPSRFVHPAIRKRPPGSRPRARSPAARRMCVAVPSSVSSHAKHIKEHRRIRSAVESVPLPLPPSAAILLAGAKQPLIRLIDVLESLLRLLSVARGVPVRMVEERSLAERRL